MIVLRDTIEIAASIEVINDIEYKLKGIIKEDKKRKIAF